MGKSVKSGIEAYNVKTKEKEEMLDAVIDKKGESRFFAKGKSSTGSTLCVAMGADNAKKAIKEGRATKGEGW